ncbi:DUF368 domain-containing protein [bacterium]|jgi:putative membrane protein|nr:DUF368 domain-containing protein [bacterium]
MILRETLKTIFHGFCIGIANIIPGISGGTLAVILGIYEKLITSIYSVFTFSFKEISKNLGFLIKIGIGVLLGVASFSKFLEYALTAFPQPVFMFFFGLILGSIPIVFKLSKINKIHWPEAIGGIITLCSMIALFFVTPSSTVSNTTPGILFFGVSGFIAAGTMVIPGISGSLILLYLGAYKPIVHAISSFNLPIIGAVGIGAICGILFFSSFIHWLFKKYHNIAYMSVIGFLAGSLLKLWPGINMNISSLISVCLGISGYFIATLLQKSTTR